MNANSEFVMQPLEIGRLISILYRSGQSFFMNNTDSLDLSGVQVGIIFYLYAHSNVSQELLTRAMEVDKATITRSVNKLEKNAVVERKRDEHDQRINRIVLTDYGHAIRSDLRQIAQQWQDILLDGFTDDEVVQLSHLFSKLTDNARKYRTKSIEQR